MSVFVVTWNLNKEGAAYSAARTRFLQQLSGFSYQTDPNLESVAWVSTTLNATQVRDHLRAGMDDNDRLFVSKLNSGEYQGWLQQNVWEWIRQRL